MCGENSSHSFGRCCSVLPLLVLGFRRRGGGALAGMEAWTRLCADKDGEANMCYGKWTGDDDYSMPLELRGTYQQCRVMSMLDNLLE